LAIFNLDEEQKYYFKGLNTPSNTILIFGLFWIQPNFLLSSDVVTHVNLSSVFWILVTIASSWLLVSPIKMIAMKFKSKKIQDNYPKIVLLVGSIIILAVLGITGIPWVIIYYIVVSIIFQKQLT
jgi:CDP-diacylglycerol--serine O-phosphatidyltransferase